MNNIREKLYCVCRYDLRHKQLRCGKPDVSWDYETEENMLAPAEIREKLAESNVLCGLCARRAVGIMLTRQIEPEFAESAY